MSYYIGCPSRVNSWPFSLCPVCQRSAKVPERCQILMYADDTVMYFTASNAQEISSALTSELAKVNDWFVDNSILFTKAKQNVFYLVLFLG